MSKPKRSYKTDEQISVVMDRHPEMYAEMTTITEKWDVVTGKESGNLCGNVRAVFDVTGKAKLIDLYIDGEKYVSSHDQISSALALYRLVSTFHCGLRAKDCDFYKFNWSITLRHKATGQQLSFGEWKGGFTIFTPFTNMIDLSKFPIYRADVEELLTLIVNPLLPIGYDGTVAGSVA